MKPHEKYKHLVKEFELRDGPAGLYPKQLFWYEGAKDLEGFGACYAFMYITETGLLHPTTEGQMLVHPYDELIVFETLNKNDILSFDAEISIEIGEGEDRELHTFTRPTVVLVPKGVPHGPARVTRLGSPIVHYNISLAPEYAAETIQVTGEAKKGGTKYADNIRFMTGNQESRNKEISVNEGSGMGYEKVMGDDGVLYPSDQGIGPGNGTQCVWLYGEDLQGFDVNFTWGIYGRVGKWHKGGEMHTHPEEEILVAVGWDPENPLYLGAELEHGMGPECDRYVLNKPGLFIAPKGFPHLPMITRWSDVEAFGFMVVCLDGHHGSPWVEADLDALEASGQW
jgi:hypothetical protein